MKKLHPSSAAFMWGDTVVTEYSSGCLRQILIGANGVRTEIPETYERVGKAHEDQHEKQLIAADKFYQREVPIKVPIDELEDIQISGRADFIVLYEKLGKVIHETKGTISKNTRLKVIRKGLIKVNQLAQLVAYMLARQISYGKLVCAYYEEDEKDQLINQEEREFRVEIDEQGSVLVDGLPSGFSVYDQMAHRTAAATVITENTVGPRPDKWDDPWKGPCVYCAFKDTCKKFDEGQLKTTEEFIDSAKIDAEIADINKRPDPQPFKIKVKKPRKEKGKKNVV